MFLPPNMTESGVVAAIENVVNLLAPQFAFGYYSVDDMKQQGWVYSLEVLPKFQSYDESGNVRPLANFIYTRVFRKFLNLQRDQWHKPCPVQVTCSGVSPEDEQQYNRWKDTNTLKKSVLMPTAIANGVHAYNNNDENIREIEIKEIEEIIDERLDVSMRSWYLQLKAGEALPYARRMAVMKEVKKIVKDIVICQN
jgi:hypothetical protein